MVQFCYYVHRKFLKENQLFIIRQKKETKFIFLLRATRL
jgi:hypothetical protein